jgi:lipid-A-disaccharide synthase
VKLYLIAGEASGDARGAELMKALRARLPAVDFLGAGGREMKALAGDAIHDWADEAVVGLWDVLKKYGYFRRQFHRMLADIEHALPDAVVFIDYPGFNLRLAHALRGRRVKAKLIFYISPQVWAWHRGRIPKMAKDLDLMLCLFPFEAPLYEASGLTTVCVGHPLLDSLEEKRLRPASSSFSSSSSSSISTAAPRTDERDLDLVGLFPGSREKEVRRIFPIMLEAASLLQIERPETRFHAAAANPALAALMREQLRAHDLDAAFCRIEVGGSRELMQRAGAGMVASGTATLEAAFFGLPLVILYHVAWLTWVVGKRLVRVPFLGMPNILAGREIAREFLQDEARPPAIAEQIRRLLDDVETRAQIERDLASVIAQLGERGAAVRAAEAIVEALGVQNSPLDRTPASP